MRRLMIVPLMALVLGSSVGAAAPGISTSGEQPGASCGAAAPVAPAAGGVLGPGESHWYDASYLEGGARQLQLMVGPPNEVNGIIGAIPYEASITLYSWDRSTNACTEIEHALCAWPNATGVTLPCPINPDHRLDGVVTQPGPGDYQVEVYRSRFFARPNAYTVTLRSL